VDSFVARLQRMLWIEEWLAHELLPNLLQQVTSNDLQYGIERHLLETKQHALTVRTILTLLGEPHDPLPSEALPLLVGEIAEVTDLLAHLEHLEIAGYTQLRSTANALGEDDIGTRLTEILEQEEYALELVHKATAKLLAERVTNAEPVELG
jgi:ferritin-like metal-binding protein YciE